MRIQKIFTGNVNYIRPKVLEEKNTTNPVANSRDIVSFGNSYNSLFAKAIKADFNIKSYSEISSLFSELWVNALSEGKARDSVARQILSRSYTSYMRDTLKKFDQGYDAGLIKYDEIIVERNGVPLVTADQNFVNFCDPVWGRYHNDIKFGMDGDKVVIERLYDKAKFYDNNRLYSYTRHTTDFRESKTTYYKRNGEENSWKTFLSDMMS